jgi:hypothetical protein
MAAAHSAMMQNHGMMRGGMMHGPMMRGGRDGNTPPDRR